MADVCEVGFVLSALRDPIHGFESHAGVMLEVLDGIVKGLFSGGGSTTSSS